MALTIAQFQVGGYDSNLSYVIFDTVSKMAAIVDPSGDYRDLASFVEDEQLSVEAFWLTHTHFDHYDQLSSLQGLYGTVPIYVHEAGREVVGPTDSVRVLLDDTTLTLGEHKVMIIETPGHVDTAVCFFVPAEASASGTPLLISGDTLFVGGCGRTNEAHVAELYESLQRLAKLPGETVVYPGHDYGDSPSSTIAHELKENRFYQVSGLEEFKDLRLS